MVHSPRLAFLLRRVAKFARIEGGQFKAHRSDALSFRHSFTIDTLRKNGIRRPRCRANSDLHPVRARSHSKHAPAAARRRDALRRGDGCPVQRARCRARNFAGAQEGAGSRNVRFSQRRRCCSSRRSGGTAAVACVPTAA